MAIPVNETFNAPAGSTMSLGRFAPVLGLDLSGNWIVFGDSITALTYQSGGYRWGLPLTMLSPKVVYNAGVANDTLNMIYARQDADVTSKSPDVVMIRAGTNSLGDATSTFRAKFRQIIDKALTGGASLVLCSIPLKSGVSQATIDAHNTWLSDQAVADPAHIVYIDDSATLTLADTVDGIHMNGSGAYKQGKAQAVVLTPLLPTTSPLITSGTDIYPANGASDQWVQNPFNTGTAGAMYYATGTVPTGWGVSCGGVTSNGAIASIVAANTLFPGDSNLTPWLCVELTQGVNNGVTSVGTTLGNPAMAADLTIKRVDSMIEVYVESLATAAIGNISFLLQRSGVDVMPAVKLPISSMGSITERMVIRNSYPRDEASSGAATPVAYPPNSLSLSLDINFVAGFSSSIGKIYMRRASARGQAA